MSESKYLKLYNYFKNMILSGTMEENSKMPSIRSCSESFELSRTTVETAYEMLCAEGYIFPKAQSGFYVCSIENQTKQLLPEKEEKNVKFNLVSSSADKAAFNFALWRRYVKSALRQDERLLSYGESQGEPDLRESICTYINKQRGLICSPSQIVISAGTQNLIGILCGITKDRKTVSFIGSGFAQGKTVFEDYGKEIQAMVSVEDYSEKLNGLKPSIIYTSPSHIDSWGNVMTVSQRRELLKFEKENDCLIIEDDYDSEFRYSGKPVPPLQSMNGGENVVYIGTFSRLLIPSIRISFMVLPQSLLERYNERKNLYNQTASKAEQIALCQYIRDGHLGSQIRKQKKQYAQKTAMICERANNLFEKKIRFEECEAGYLIRIIVKTNVSAEAICSEAERFGLLMRPVKSRKNEADILISVAGFDINSFDEFYGIFCAVCENLNV